MEAPKTPASPSLSGGGSASGKLRRANRPRITITIPPHHQQLPMRHSPYYGPSTATTIPPTALTGDANLRRPSFFDPFSMDHPAKYGDFMSKQFEGIKDFTKSGLGHGEKVALWVYEKFSSWSKKWFTHIFLVTVMLLYSLAGASIFKAIEGTHEEKLIMDVRKESFAVAKAIRELTYNARLTRDQEQWEDAIVQKLDDFRQSLFQYYKNGYNNSPEKVWSFWNSVFYCGTIYTTIGYGHISPTTTTGRAITIVYAVIGIPIFLILLADFGKLFTRGIKFLWSYVRRLYYTGSCRKVRKQAQVQDMMRGINMAYEIATFRRPSAFAKDEEDGKGVQDGTTTTGLHLSPSQQDIGTPQTPMPSEIEIDDEFNLPISLAFFILITYILIGASIYSMWEEWSFFESFYFVFISMSTIGFGDFVPNHPMYMMASIVYLMFGLSLTSMCINVVQVKLSDSFKHASAKIGATIGLKMAEEASLKNSQNGSPVDLASVHSLHSTSPKIEISGTDTQSAADS